MSMRRNLFLVILALTYVSVVLTFVIIDKSTLAKLLYRYELESVRASAKWDIARQFENSNRAAREVAEEWYLRRIETANQDERRTAMMRLGKMRSIKSITRLLEVLRSGNDVGYCIQALREIGEPAIDGLVEMLKKHRC